MLRWLTAGESHGPALVATLEGLPAGVRVTTGDVAAALARRRLGHGRGARMSFEQDRVEFLGGVRHGVTQGGPVAVTVANTEWPKWERVMSPDPIDTDELAGLARNAPLTRPRPGHADLAGMQKYGFDDARPERSPGRWRRRGTPAGHRWSPARRPAAPRGSRPGQGRATPLRSASAACPESSHGRAREKARRPQCGRRASVRCSCDRTGVSRC